MLCAFRSPSRARRPAGQVVDAGAAAADRLVGRLEQLEPGDRAQCVARLLPHPLCVEEVARVLERDPNLERPPLGPRAELGEKLGHVLHRHVEPRLLQVGAAAGGVDDDRVDPDLLKPTADRSHQLLSLPASPGVMVERAAAGLVAGNDDLAALGGEHARRRQVDVAEDDVPNRERPTS